MDVVVGYVILYQWRISLLLVAKDFGLDNSYSTLVTSERRMEAKNNLEWKR